MISRRSIIFAECNIFISLLEFKQKPSAVGEAFGAVQTCRNSSYEMKDSLSPVSSHHLTAWWSWAVPVFSVSVAGSKERMGDISDWPPMKICYIKYQLKANSLTVNITDLFFTVATEYPANCVGDRMNNVVTCMQKISCQVSHQGLFHPHLVFRDCVVTTQKRVK